MPFGLYGPAPRTLADLMAWVDEAPERRIKLIRWLLERLRDPRQHDELLIALVLASMIHNAHLGIGQNLIDELRKRTNPPGEGRADGQAG